MKLTYKIKDEDLYKTVLEVLKAELHISERLLHRLKKNEMIFLNNLPIFPYAEVHLCDEISVVIDFNENSDNILPTKMNLDILYEDDAYVIVNKSANIPVHPSMDHYTDSLSNGLKYYFESIGLGRKIRPVNRIDKNTSGIVIFAKNEYVQENLIKQMNSKEFYKEYIAVCNGIFDKKNDIICAPIARKENSIIERCVSPDGDFSITEYDVLEENLDNNYSVVRCILKTGRTHQIRVHMTHINHPLLGDTLYGTESNLIARQALHSYKVSFNHPITKKIVEYIAPIPNDMNILIDSNNISI